MQCEICFIHDIPMTFISLLSNVELYNGRVVVILLELVFVAPFGKVFEQMDTGSTERGIWETNETIPIVDF